MSCRHRWLEPLRAPGPRLHLVMVAAAVVYLGVHAWVGAQALQADLPLQGVLLALTALSAVGNLFLAVPVWVYAGALSIRGPRPLVRMPPAVPDAALPRIVVQIPGRNEPLEEVRRSIDSVLLGDYPTDKLTVQFVDNSDDDRWHAVAALYAAEPRVSVEHRDGTRGFKGGNLNHGLRQLEPFEDPDQLLIGLLDVGDTFAPKVLRPMATEFVHDPSLGFVQDMFRAGNPSDTIVAWSDAHVGDAARRFIEGYAARYGLPTMNGHCALLRMSALEACGRWDEARVAEDWSTGIRMLVGGWNGKWVDYDPVDPSMVSTELVPGDIPAQQKQKRRWATGGTELARSHLAGWLRSGMPWHLKMALVLRLGANLCVVPALVAQLVFPLWLALVVAGEGSPAVRWLGLASVTVQNPHFVANLAAALAYLREGRPRAAALATLAYPVQALWRLPLLVHACVGFAEGLGSGLKEFVITPKGKTTASPLAILRSQWLVVAVSLLPTVPLISVLAARPERADALALFVLGLPMLTVAALWMVPSTQWAWHRLGPGAPR